MPSGQTIINAALTALGINEQGGTPSASDSVDALAELNRQWDSWSIDEGLIYSVKPITKALTTAVASYTIGSGAAFNVVRPQRIYRAFYTDTGNRNELKIVDAGQYFGHADLTATAKTPDEVYPDFDVDPTTGFGKVYIWPVPTFASGAPTLELDVAAAFAAWTLATVQILPAGYEDAISEALAGRLIPRFGMIVPQEIQLIVGAIAQKAEQRIRVMNERNRQLPPGAGMIPVTPPPAKAA